MNWLSSNKISAPDGVEAWTVAFAACVINFVMAGLARMAGIMYVAFIDIFEVDRKEASLPFSIRGSMRNLLGPVVGILGQKYGVRPVATTGAIIGAISAGICVFAQDMVWVTVFYGGLSGVGASLATTLNQAIIGQHFKKYKTTAAGMTFSGGCVGSFLFPVLIEYLLHTYGLQGTFLIISGILLHVIPATLCLRKPTWTKKRKFNVQIPTVCNRLKQSSNIDKNHKPEEIHEGNKRNSLISQNIGKEQVTLTKVIISNTKVPDYISEQNIGRRINKVLLWDQREFIIDLILRNLNESRLEELSRDFLIVNSEIKDIEEIFSKMLLDVFDTKGVINSIPTGIIKSIKDTNSSIQVEDKHFTNNTQIIDAFNLNLSESENQKSSILLNILSITLKNIFNKNMVNDINTFPDIDKEIFIKVLDELQFIQNLFNKCSTFIEENKRSNSIYSHVKTAYSLYKKPIFLLICFCRTVHTIIVIPLFTSVVDYTMDKGLPQDDGKYVIGALSLGDLLGRLCLGWISDRGYIGLPKFMMIGMILQGAFLASLSVMHTRVTLLSTLAMCGLLQGSLFVRHPVLVNRYLASHEQSIAMGCLNFFSGILAFMIPIYIGYFRDVIGSYNGIFYINGALQVFIGLFWGFENYIKNLSGRCK